VTHEGVGDLYKNDNENIIFNLQIVFMERIAFVNQGIPIPYCDIMELFNKRRCLLLGNGSNKHTTSV
jgi:hypothetical protein